MVYLDFTLYGNAGETEYTIYESFLSTQHIYQESFELIYI